MIHPVCATTLAHRDFSSSGALLSEALLLEAREAAWELWHSPSAWISYVEHVELRAAGAREHLGRSRAVIRDVARIFVGLTSRGRATLNNGTYWGAILPSRGKFWRFPSMARFLRTSAVHRDALYHVTDDGEWRHDVIFLHTSKRVATELSAVAVQKFEAGAVHIREGCRLASVLADAILTGVLKDQTAAHEARLPAVQSCWAPWLSKQMDLATARLRRAPVQAAVIPLVTTMLDSMVPGREADHLSSLLTWPDHRGSDVVLASGVIVNGSTQIAPYPAMAWAWNCVQSYKWTASQHINLLELNTLLNFLRFKAISGCLCSQRFFHVFDSQVAASVSTKGRSSSKALNRVCRRLCAILLATNCFCVSLWTVSGRQFSDSGSRVAEPDDHG